jgi:LPS sulfotransferase NodH
VWRKEQELAGTAEPEYSPVAVERAERLIDEQEASWSAMFADLGLTPLTLWYEDAVADPVAAVSAVAGFLGVALDRGAEVAVPEIARQSQRGARAWAERHGGA